MGHDLSDKFERAPYGVSPTKRLTVAAAEEILNVPYACLDHGFVRLVDYMGGDAAVVQAARVSYGSGTKKTNEDEGLIRFLMRHRHSTPFEMTELKFHAKMPIFVARQWIRHRTASINEISARYSILDNEFYIPEPEALGVQARNIKQGRDEPVSSDQARDILNLLKEDSVRAYQHYEYLLNEGSEVDDKGNKLPKDSNRPLLARELARMGLSLNVYTQWYWKANLHNVFRFLGLRKDKHAQHEIRVFADAMGDMTERVAPSSYAAFRDYELDGVHLSILDRRVMKDVLSGVSLDLAASKHITNARERKECIDKISAMKNL